MVVIAGRLSLSGTSVGLPCGLVIIARFHELEGERDRKRTEQSFFGPRDEIVSNDYDLSINKYKQTEYKAVEYPPTSEIMAKLDELEKEIGAEMNALRELLGL